MDEVGIGFLYAPLLHGAMRHVIGPRREIGLRTIFNVLGPLTNPAGATVQVLGVYREDLTDTIANVLGKLGCKSAFVAYGKGSYDEISITGPSRISRLLDGSVHTSTITPEDMGMKRAKPEDIRGGDAGANAAIVKSVLGGEMSPRRDMVILNASAALVAAGVAKNLEYGVTLASESIDSGRAIGKLNALVELGKGMTQETQAAAG